MSGLQLLRLRVNERLEAAVEEIFGLVEKTITEYEEEAVRAKREIGQLKQQLKQLVVLRPKVVLTRTDTQPVAEERLPSLQQYEIKAEEIPILEEAKIQEHPRAKEEPAERRLSPDMEVDTCNKAEVKREIDHMKQHMELPAVLKAEVTSFRADMQEMCPSQQPDRLVTVEEMTTHDAKQIREEQVEISISPDVDADAFNVDEVRDPDSEPDEFCEPLSSSAADSMDDEESIEMDQSSPLQSRSAELGHPQRRDKFGCFCGKQFSKDSFLTRHVATSHNGHQTFRCLDCKKEFEKRCWMVRHTRIHTGERPSSCDFCDKTFASNASRLYHMKKHTGKKLSTNQKEALTCFICNKVFTRKQNLNRHKRVHET